MARIEAEARLCYVPTPPEVVRRLVALLHIPDKVVALDPCCGGGDALHQLAPKGRLYGIELELDRAEQARKRLTSVMACAMQEARVSNEVFGLCLLNPPYAGSTAGRLEPLFLDRCTNYLAAGGILINIIKPELYAGMVRTLARHYDLVGHWRFPDPYFDGPELSFGQSVLIARKRRLPAVNRDPAAFADELGFRAPLPVLPESLPDRVDVPMGRVPFTWVAGQLSDDDVAKLLARSPVERRMKVPQPLDCGQPPLPLKQGHLALVMASGLVNGVYGSGPTLHVAKGSVVRMSTTTKEADTTQAGNEAMIEKTIDSFAICMRALRPNGTIHELSGAAAGTAAASAEEAK